MWHAINNNMNEIKQHAVTITQNNKKFLSVIHFGLSFDIKKMYIFHKKTNDINNATQLRDACDIKHYHTTITT